MLIGYEASHDRGPVVLFKTSINFLTGVEYDDENINAYNFNADSDDDSEIDEVFKRTVVKLKKKAINETLGNRRLRRTQVLIAI